MKRKRGGFKSFVRRRDGKSPVPEVSALGLSEVADVVPSYLLKVLCGQYVNLIYAFTWKSTPQGGDYWLAREEGEMPLSPEDYRWLQELYDYHANR